MEKLSFHVELAGKINAKLSEDGLKDLGQIEQDHVFGDARNKELIEYLQENEDGNDDNKLRLVMIYALADPESFDGEKATRLMEELIEKIEKHDLPKDEYPCMNEPSSILGVVGHAPKRAAQQSRRSRRTRAHGKYASDDRYSSVHACRESQNVVFTS